MSKGIFLISDFSPLDTDNFTGALEGIPLIDMVMEGRDEADPLCVET